MQTSHSLRNVPYPRVLYLKLANIHTQNRGGGSLLSCYQVAEATPGGRGGLQAVPGEAGRREARTGPELVCQAVGRLLLFGHFPLPCS